MPPFPVMFKTVSSDCNLDCEYCYYRESLEGARTHRRIGERLLEQFIPKYMDYVADVGIAGMSWQGGEPTLIGLPFFEKVVALQAAHAHRSTMIANSLQTNGVLLNDDWGSFLKRHNWLVGVSLDGPQEIHDRFRRDRGGHGSFERVMQGIEALRRHAVDFNILCVLGPHNVDEPRELMRFFRQQQFTHVQYIPAMAFQALEPEKPPAYLITAEQYGFFLTEAFDDWHQSGAPTLSVRIFDNFLQTYAGIPNELCAHSDRCDAGIVLEYDGSAYPCDFYIGPQWQLGNVLDTPLAEIAAGAARQSFVARKASLPEACGQCSWLMVCKGGCVRNWTFTTQGPTPDYFCAAYQRFYPRAAERLQDLAGALQNKWRYLDIMETDPRRIARAGRNDPCPCGSGKKHKHCCASPAREASYVFHQ